MGKYQAYPKYKDSGVEWIGNIPEHWDKKRIKETASLINGYPFDSKFFEAGKGVPLVRIRDIRSSSTEVGFVGDVPKESLINNGDLLIGMDGDFNVSIWGGGLAALNQRVACVRAPYYHLQKYIFYTLPFNMKVVNDLTYFTTVKHLSSIDILKSAYPLPPKIELTTIVDFLDHETAKIDTLIDKQQQLIQLLKEKRQAVISHAVTKGLNPNAPMRDSGVEWLGEVPEHWDILSIKYLSDFVGTGGTPKNESSFCETAEVNWFTPGDFKGELTLNESSKFVTRDACNTGDAKLYPAGSILVIGIGATLGKVEYCEIDFSCNQQINIITPNEKTNGAFLRYSLSVQTEQMKQLSNASTIGIMNQEKTKQICLAIPPAHEQGKIVTYLLVADTRYSELLKKAQAQISLLQERRTALISAAVTGKIDVRHHASRPAGGLQPSKSTVHGDL